MYNLKLPSFRPENTTFLRKISYSDHRLHIFLTWESMLLSVYPLKISIPNQNPPGLYAKLQSKKFSSLNSSVWTMYATHMSTELVGLYLKLPKLWSHIRYSDDRAGKKSGIEFMTTVQWKRPTSWWHI